ncbi:hypothetical protein N8I77_006719 [Diaporthe amygdali]|uniref:Uncharacterized protein n=1 Tax=Phomopsis amygdali TaxID=1214568 RepID=A0AAD9SIK7_PHOAM|nr:hypothetical protein N8I77_006719 [Diaporthe amygdali]
MDEPSPRSREVANALFQIDKLTEDQVRAVLRHLTIDDAVLNEVHCSHIACVINGTLHNLPREGVNASLTCSTNLDAASHWEKHFATYPGHVSATFRSGAVNGNEQVDQSPKHAAQRKEKQTAPAETNDLPSDTDPVVRSLLDMKGLPIINHGNLTLHYHSYAENSFRQSQPDIVPCKRTLEKTEDEQYSEALASLTDCNDPVQQDLSLETSAKRLKTMKPQVETVGNRAIKVEPESVEQCEDQDEVANDPCVTEQKKRTKRARTCARCGEHYEKADNEGFNMPCCYHPGAIKKYPHGLKTQTGTMRQLLFMAWDCCQKDPDSRGCSAGRHTRSLK